MFVELDSENPKEGTSHMGSPTFADDHTYEVIREYSHQSRRKRTDVLRELAQPLEERLAKEFGVRVVDGRTVPVDSSSGKKIKK